MKKLVRIGGALFFVLLFCVLQISAAAQTHHWYCMRNKAHLPPPCAPEFAFIEECGGCFLDHHAGERGDKVVYLTFDAGYENGNVARVLDTLEKTQTPAAFFVLKHFIQANPTLIERMLAQGHLVCNHTAHHPNLSEASAERIKQELGELEETYRALTGKELAPYFRPPEGSFSRELLLHVQSLGYKTVFWSFAYADWDNNKQPSPQKAMQCIMDNIHNGAVLLLHPTSQTNAEILPQIIEELRAQGYRFGSLEELCGDR